MTFCHKKREANLWGDSNEGEVLLCFAFSIGSFDGGTRARDAALASRASA
jgi:hypothetical protein